MALTKLTTNLNNIQALHDRPNTSDGLTADELKERFDRAGNDIKSYINNTLTDEIDTALANTSSTTYIDQQIANLSNTYYNKTQIDSTVATLQPRITYGTGTPTGGSNGDIYIKYSG